MSLPSLSIHTVYVRTPTGIDANGDPAYGEVWVAKCRVESRVRQVNKGPEGDEVQSETVIYTESVISQGDVIWLPGTDPDTPEDGIRVSVVTKTPSLDGRTALYEIIV